MSNRFIELGAISMLLKEKVAVVTSGGRGIGRAIAKKFATEGASMVVTARSQKEIDEVSAEIRAAGGEASSVVADVSREQDCQKIVDRARQAFGRIHILVNNAGVLGPVRPVEQTTTSEWDKVMAVNLRGPFMLSRFVLPEMYEHGSGAILNIVSIAAKAAFQLNAGLGRVKSRIDRLDPHARSRGSAQRCARECAEPGTGSGDENVERIRARTCRLFQRG